MCFFKNQLPWISILVPFFISTGFLAFGFIPIFFTASILIFSTFLFKFSKKNPIFLGKPEKDESLSNPESEIENKDESLSNPEEIENNPQKSDFQEVEVTQISEYLVKSEDPFSESESIDQSTTSDEEEDSGDVDRSPDFSDDGSISDEESLIEIALPSGHYVGGDKEKTEVPKCNLKQRFQDFSPETIFRQQSLIELLAEINEMNEEENLIEIDISMGSIKCCSRFEIEA